MDIVVFFCWIIPSYQRVYTIVKHQNYAAFNNNPYIAASHQAALIHVSVEVSSVGAGGARAPPPPPPPLL